MLATADSLPIHVLVGPDMMAQAMKTFHPDLKAGDAYLHNSPYHGNSHAADHTIFVPVIDEAGAHRFTLAVKAHQADCGNSLPTTVYGFAVDVYNEGALIFPAVKVQEDYRDIEDIIRMCEMRIRVPSQWRGDFLAMIGAARIGEREILAFGREVGWDRLDLFGRQWFDYSERRMDARFGNCRKRRRRRAARMTHIPGTSPGGIPIVAVIEFQSRRRDDRRRPYGEHGRPALRTEPHRILLQDRGSSRSVQQRRRRYPAQRRKLPSNSHPSSGRRGRRHPETSHELFGLDDQSRRPRHACSLSRLKPTWRRFGNRGIRRIPATVVLGRVRR